MFDLVVTNGRLIDPARGIDGLYDIAVSEGKIAGVYPQGAWQANYANKSLSAEGCIVTPGLIDIHTHLFAGETELGIQADLVGIEQGVTTVVDAGSTGADNVDRFVEQVVQPSDTRVLTWLNVAAPGLCEGRSELADLSHIRESAIATVLQQHAEMIRGIKVRMSSSVLQGRGLEPLVMAKRIAKEYKLPIMVHIGNAPPGLGEVLDLLGPGDVVTHAFHGKAGGMLSQDGTPIPQVVRALLRGVKLDVGHGTSSFSFHTMRQALAVGIRPNSISTDIYLANYHGPVYSLATTMSKALTLGLSLPEVIAAATIGPARLLRLDAGQGTLETGTEADISILRLADIETDYLDSEGNCLVGRQQLLPVYTIKAGKVHICK